MKLFTLKRTNLNTNQEEFLCRNAEVESVDYDSHFLRHDFNFETEENINKYGYQIFFTVNEQELIDKNIPDMDNEDSNIVFGESEYSKLEIISTDLKG